MRAAPPAGKPSIPASGSDRTRPRASQIAPTTPSLDARRQRCASASTSRCFPPESRTSGDSDAADPLLAAGARAREDRRFRRGRHRRPRRTPTARHAASPVRTHRELRASSARPPRTRPGRPERERQHRRDRSAAANSPSSDISRPDSRTRKSPRSSSFRPTRSKRTSSGSTKSSGSRLASKRSPKHVASASSNSPSRVVAMSRLRRPYSVPRFARNRRRAARASQA